jgi:DNA replication ATP-dependent helicase Dna2
MSLIENLYKAINLEYSVQVKQQAEKLRLPIEERVLKGDTITNLKIHIKGSPKMTAAPVSADGKFGFLLSEHMLSFQLVHVYSEKNLSKFSEGSRVVLHKDSYRFELIVISDDNNEMILQSDFNWYDINKSQQDSTGWQLDTYVPDIRHIIGVSGTILRSNANKYNYIRGIFEGEILPDFSLENEKKAIQIVKKTELNEIQRTAFIKAYSANNFFLIQGPPGTGKTWLLAHLATQFASEGKKVLITAFTHTGINNALQKCSILSPDLGIYKIGKSYQAQSLNYGGSKAKTIGSYTTSGTAPDIGIIIGATAYSPYTKKLSSVNWDIIIFDEAGQMPVHLAIAAMAKGEKYIFIGDHKQLPPIIPEAQYDPVFTKSIFEHLFQYSDGVMLEVTYRMNKAINEFPSKAFYSGKLKPHPDNENLILEIDNKFQKHQAILNIHQPEVLVCHQHDTTESRSEFEAVLIAELVKEYFDNGIQLKDIAIITPLRAQVREIKFALSQLFTEETFKKDLFIDTVEKMQGQERDIIIYSLVVSDPVKAMQRPEFYFNPNRLNVAITRAKKKRIVIGNKNLFQINTTDENLVPLVRVFKEFFEASYLINV